MHHLGTYCICNVIDGAIGAARIRCIWDIRLWRVSKYEPFYSGENLANVLEDRYEYHPEFAPAFKILAAEYIASQFPDTEVVHL